MKTQRYSDKGMVNHTPFRPRNVGKVNIKNDLNKMDLQEAMIPEYLPLFRAVKKLEPRMLKPLMKKPKLIIVKALPVIVIRSGVCGLNNEISWNLKTLHRVKVTRLIEVMAIQDIFTSLLIL